MQKKLISFKKNKYRTLAHRKKKQEPQKIIAVNKLTQKPNKKSPNNRYYQKQQTTNPATQHNTNDSEKKNVVIRGWEDSATNEITWRQ